MRTDGRTTRRSEHHGEGYSRFSKISNTPQNFEHTSKHTEGAARSKSLLLK